MVIKAKMRSFISEKIIAEFRILKIDKILAAYLILVREKTSKYCFYFKLVFLNNIRLFLLTKYSVILLENIDLKKIKKT